MGKLDGKIALVTGSSRGIGREIALTYAREGADVICNYNKSRADGESLVKAIEDLGLRAPLDQLIGDWGRMIAAALMIAGVALLGVITASIASWFVERIRAVEDTEVQTSEALRVLVAEVRALRAELEKRESAAVYSVESASRSE